MTIFQSSPLLSPLTANNIANCMTRLDSNLESVQIGSFCQVNELDLMHDPAVFSPEAFSSTAMFAKHLPYPENGTFLEIGTGVGAIAITAAMKYQNKVVATDINSKAVEIARQNVSKYSLDELVDCREGDLFSPVSKNEKFDVIFWNWPFIYAPNDYQYQNDLEISVVDPGYQMIQQFLSEAKDHLSLGGKIILTFASHGKQTLFDKILHDGGYFKEEVYSEKIGPNTYNIFEIKKTL